MKTVLLLISIGLISIIIGVSYDPETLTHVEQNANGYRVTLNGEITEDSVRPLIQVLYTAKATEFVDIIIDRNNGGEALAGFEVIQAMRESKALYITTFVTKYAASMAADIAISGDEVHLLQGAKLLFHLGQSKTIWGSVHVYTAVDQYEDSKHGKYVRDLEMWMHTQLYFLTAAQDWKVIDSGAILVVYDDQIPRQYNGRHVPNAILEQLIQDTAKW